jgi:hypothetical protein
MEEECGQIQQFPNISAVRYGTFGTGATHIIADLDAYRKFMINICYSKEKPGLTNIEKNVSDGLEDIPTLTELCVHALYSEFVSQPLVQELRAYGIDGINGISLGPLHDAVITHLSKIHDNPSLWLHKGSSLDDVALKGTKIAHINAIKAVRELVPSLPHIVDALTAFLDGASETYARFSGEFSRGGEIDSLMPAEIEKIFIPSTNDANEGALGQLRCMKRLSACMTQMKLNAIQMTKRNGVDSFIVDSLSEDDQKALMMLARMRDRAGHERERKREIREANSRKVADSRQRAEVAKEKAKARQESLKRLSEDVVYDLEGIKALKTKKAAKRQLDAHRYLHPDDKDIPRVGVFTSMDLDGQKEALVRIARKYHSMTPPAPLRMEIDAE